MASEHVPLANSRSSEDGRPSPSSHIYTNGLSHARPPTSEAFSQHAVHRAHPLWHAVAKADRTQAVTGPLCRDTSWLTSTPSLSVICFPACDFSI